MSTLTEITLWYQGWIVGQFEVWGRLVTCAPIADPLAAAMREDLASASGEREKSAAVYKDLLTVWKDADPDIPVVQEAKAESAKLP